MRVKALLVFTVVLGAVQVLEGKLPSYIKPCKIGPTIEACVLGQQETVIANLKDGDSANKINSFNPMEVEQLKVVDNGGSRSVAMNITFNKMKIWGLPDGRLKTFKMDPVAKRLEWDVACPKGLRMESKYTVNGKVLVLPIQGDGDIWIFMDDMKLHFILHYDVEKKGKSEVVKIMKTDMTHSMKNMSLHMDNLFNGDKLLGTELNIVMNDNWQELNKQVGPPISQALALAVKPIFERIVARLSFNEIFLS